MPKAQIIAQSAFYQCEALEEVNLPMAEVIKETAFDKCKALRDPISALLEPLSAKSALLALYAKSALI